MGDELVEDVEGIDLPNIAAVEDEALLASREIVAELVRNGLSIGNKRLEIADKNGNIIVVFPFVPAVLDSGGADQ